MSSKPIPNQRKLEKGQEERVKMTRLRQTIAKRLKESQNTAAMLTTFNEVDMKPIMDLRKKYKDAFKEKYAVGLGFMSKYAMIYFIICTIVYVFLNKEFFFIS